MDKAVFWQQVQEKYGDKVALANLSENLVESFRRLPGYHGMTWAALNALNPVIYPVGNTCPECSRQLLGPLGSFDWDSVHGEGGCACGQVAYRLLHYVEGCERPIHYLEIIGIPK